MKTYNELITKPLINNFISFIIIENTYGVIFTTDDEKYNNIINIISENTSFIKKIVQ